ncbi:MAG TPA: CDP-alcohol phosphatidyltransferase family protein [Chitinophagaceae bacterium]
MDHSRAYYLVNSITWYRLVAAPLLLILVFAGNMELFKWMLAVSFFTDAVDGFLARRYKVVSTLGSRIDSLADDFTILVAIVAIVVEKPEFLRQQTVIVAILVLLFLLQLAFAMLRYRRPSSFHTYLAKIAAVLQGVFILLLFFLPQPPLLLFYIAAVVTAFDLLEEIALTALVKNFTTDVRGIYWWYKSLDHKQ